MQSVRPTAVIAALLLALPNLILPSSARAQAGAGNFPSRPVTIIVGQAPGGIMDSVSRLYSAELSPRLKQQVIVENRPGADGLIGARAVANAAPDGYSLHIGTGSGQSRLVMKTGLDLLKDLAPVSVLMSSAYGFFASNKYKSLEEVVAMAKANPGHQFNFASAGAFNTLAMAMLKAQTGINYVTVTYKGGVPIAQALAVNEVDFTLGATASFLPMMKAGKIRLLFLTRPSTSLPDAPDSTRVGLQNFTPGTNIGVWAPAATPVAVLNRLSGEFASATRPQAMQEKIRAAFATEPVGSTAEEMRRIVEADLRFWSEAARLAKFTPE